MNFYFFLQFFLIKNRELGTFLIDKVAWGMERTLISCEFWDWIYYLIVHDSRWMTEIMVIVQSDWIKGTKLSVQSPLVKKENYRETKVDQFSLEFIFNFQYSSTPSYCPHFPFALRKKDVISLPLYKLRRQKKKSF